MKPKSPQWSGELQLTLQSAYSELVRAFVREAALAEGLPVSCASLIADDSAETWLALSAGSQGGELAHVGLLFSRRNVSATILLPGNSQLSKLVESLSGRLRRGAGISCREIGTGSWEISLHRSLTGIAEVQPSAAETPSEPASPPAIPRDFRIDLPEKSDASRSRIAFRRSTAITTFTRRFSRPRRYWTKVESGEVIPVVARGDGVE